MKVIAFYISLLAFATAPLSMSLGDQTDTRLDGLFIELAKPDQPAPVYQMLESEIWVIWGQAPEDIVQNLMSLGYQSLRLGLLNKALEQYSEVTRLAPEFAEGWNKQATVFYLMERFNESLVAVNHTLELEPRHFGALSGLGLIYEAYGEHDGARAAYTKALSYNPHMQRIKLRLKYLESIKGESDI